MKTRAYEEASLEAAAENGTLMTGPGRPSSDCAAGLETIDIQMVVARPFPVIDEEAGVWPIPATSAPRSP